MTAPGHPETVPRPTGPRPFAREPGCRRPAGEGGFTLIEVVVALALLTIGLLGFALLFVMNARSYDLANAESLVIHALRETAEKMRGSPFYQLVARYQGHALAIGEIGASGSVTIFLDETDSSPDAQRLGLPRDLNGDGSASSTNVSNNYVLLPVKIALSWSSPMGPQSEAMYLMLAQENN